MFTLPRGLTEHTDLDQLKRQAKELLRAFDAGDTGARALASQHFPNRPEDSLQLTGAQLVVARHHGFESWAKLRAHVDQANVRRLLRAMEQGDIREARSLLRQRPELATMNVAENDEHRVLHHAVLRRNELFVRALMEAGAEPIRASIRTGNPPPRTCWQRNADLRRSSKPSRKRNFSAGKR